MRSKLWTKATMEYLLDHEPAMAPRSNHRVSPVILPAVVVMIAWLGIARADDLLDQGARFHISASPLASALIEFSTQSGLQVAAADADVAHLTSNGVNGTLPIRAALSTLLRGSGLEFSRVGVETVVIRRASIEPVVGGATPAGPSAATTNMPAAKPAQPDPDANASASAEIPDVTVTAPRPPTDEELAGGSLHQFIVHHATVGNLNTSGMLPRNLPHWLGGKRSICPLTVGLSPGYNAFVTARLRALAAYVGAPVQPEAQCEPNVAILFTNNPQEEMDEVFKWATVYFRNRYSGGMRDLIKFRSDHVIQGWYLMGGALNADISLAGLNVLPVWPQIAQNYVVSAGTGTHFGGGSGSGIGVVILIVDTTKVVGNTIGTISDYLAMLTLSVVQSPDHCDSLPSILDLMSSSCRAREMPTAMTAGDLAFLKALYYRNAGPGPSMPGIQGNMMRQFKPR
jgi:hypothetical protein